MYQFPVNTGDPTFTMGQVSGETSPVWRGVGVAVIVGALGGLYFWLKKKADIKEKEDSDNAPETVTCSTKSDCPSGWMCQDGICVLEPMPDLQPISDV
jgi:hypothetical protein